MKLISLILVLVELLNFQAFPHKFGKMLEIGTRFKEDCDVLRWRRPL